MKTFLLLVIIALLGYIALGKSSFNYRGSRYEPLVVASVKDILRVDSEARAGLDVGVMELSCYLSGGEYEPMVSIIDPEANFNDDWRNPNREMIVEWDDGTQITMQAAQMKKIRPQIAMASEDALRFYKFVLGKHVKVTTYGQDGLISYMFDMSQVRNGLPCFNPSAY